MQHTSLLPSSPGGFYCRAWSVKMLWSTCNRSCCPLAPSPGDGAGVAGGGFVCSAGDVRNDQRRDRFALSFCFFTTYLVLIL